MIKRFKKPCYYVVCDNCGDGIEGSFGYVEHFENKKDMGDYMGDLEMDEVCIVEGKIHLCSEKCLDEFNKKKLEVDG